MTETLAIDGGEPAFDGEFHPWPVWDEREEEMLHSVLESGEWGNSGSQKDEFIAEFTEWLGVDHGVPVTSGTSAIVIALRALGVSPGDEVIVPPYTFVATASAVLECNAVPVFADIEPDSLCLDPEAVQDRLTGRTAAVIPVHLGGRPADLAGLQAVCEPADVPILEDCAQAHGSRIDGEALGTIGDVGCFSFQSSKNLSAGEGGFVSTDRDDVFSAAWSITNVGRVPDGDWYEHPVMGSNYRMTEWQAGILREQLTRLDEQRQRRQAAAQRLHDGLADIAGITPQSEHPDATDRAYHLYVIRLEPEELGGIDKRTFLEAVRAEGVPLGGGYSPLYQEELFTELADRVPAVVQLADEIPDYESLECPVTERASDTAAWMSQNVLLGPDEDIDAILHGFEKVADAAERLASTAT